MDRKLILFAGNDYYPRGGANDIIGFFESLTLAMRNHDVIAKNYKYDGGWAHVFSLETKEIVAWFVRGKWAFSFEDYQHLLDK